MKVNSLCIPTLSLLKQGEIAKIGIKRQLTFTFAGAGDIRVLHRCSALVGHIRTQAGPCSSKLHRSHFTAIARTPGTQSSNVLTRAGAGGAGGAFGVLAFAGICSGRLPENSIAPNGQAIPHSLQLTHRLSLSWTAPSTRLIALTGHTVAHGASSQW